MREALPYLLILLAALSNAGANIAIKKAGLISTSIFLNYYFFAGALLFAVNLAFYTFAIRRVQLSVAYPLLVGLTTLILVGVSIFILDFQITSKQVLGIVLMLISIVLLV